MKKVQKRTKCKTFVKYVNYNHMMPTRYVVPTDFDAKALVSDAQMESHETKAGRASKSRRSSTKSLRTSRRRKARTSPPRTSCTSARSCASKSARADLGSSTPD